MGAALGVPLLWSAFRGGAYDIVPRQELALVLWWVLALGVAAGLLPAARPARALLVPLAGFGLMLALSAASLDWTASQEATVAELARVALYTGTVLLVLALVDRENWAAAAAAVVGVALLVALASAISRLVPGAVSHDVERVLHTTRLNYPLNYWNAVGAWSAIAATTGLIASAHARHVAVRALALACVPACAVAVYLTYSRAGLLDLGLGLVLAVALGRNRWTTAAHAAAAAAGAGVAVLVVRGQPEIADASGSAGAPAVALALAGAAALCGGVAWLTRRAGADERWRLRPVAARRALAVVLAALVAGVAALAASDVPGRAWDEFRTPAAGNVDRDPAARLANLNSLRYELWKEGAQAWRQRPLEGIGAGTYELHWNQFATRPLTVRDAHSLYLENLAELGAGGLLAVLLVAGGLLAAAFRARPRGGPAGEVGAHACLCAAAVIFFLHAGVDWLWESTAVALLGIVCATVAAARVSAPATSRPRLPWRAGLAAAAAAVCVLQLPGIAGTLRERAARDALADGDSAAALRFSDNAVRISPWAASPVALRAEALQSAGRLDAARTDLRRAIEAEPSNWRHWFLLARLETAAGRSRAAVAALAEARRLNPLGDPFRR